MLTLIAAIATAAGLRRVAVPTPTAEAAPSLRGEIQAFRSWRLWAAMASSLLIIAATFTAFSYLTPVLHEETGVDLAIVPLLLLAYGVATVVGNIVVGRLASAHTFAVLLIGTTLNVGFLVSFALFAQVPAAAIIAMLGIGLLGVTMNPAMITRVQRVSNTGSLVNTVHTSMITLGVALGSTLGGLGITAFGLRAPLWIGAGFAVLAVLTMIPAAINARRARLALAA